MVSAADPTTDLNILSELCPVNGHEHTARRGVASAVCQQNRGEAVAISPIFRCVIVASVLLSSIPRQVRAQSQAEEYRVKAAFLFHLAQLVDWPPGTFASDSSPLNVCSIGDDPFHGDLENVLDGKPIGSRLIRVRHMTQLHDLHSCHVLFIGAGEDKRLPAILAELANAPVMTVGETEGFIEQGEMFRFTIEESKVRFEINLGAAEKAGLKISSRLLLLAKRVVRKPG
jgi:hypothetical protein